MPLSAFSTNSALPLPPVKDYALSPSCGDTLQMQLQAVFTVAKQ